MNIYDAIEMRCDQAEIHPPSLFDFVIIVVLLNVKLEIFYLLYLPEGTETYCRLRHFQSFMPVTALASKYKSIHKTGLRVLHDRGDEAGPTILIASEWPAVFCPFRHSIVQLTCPPFLVRTPSFRTSCAVVVGTGLYFSVSLGPRSRPPFPLYIYYTSWSIIHLISLSSNRTTLLARGLSATAA